MQCEWIKDNGERCKRTASEGERYCSSHLGKALEKQTAVDSAPEGKVDVPTIHNTLKKVPIRFTGKGTYSIPSENVNFVRSGQVERVSHETWKRLLESNAGFEEV